MGRTRSDRRSANPVNQRLVAIGTLSVLAIAAAFGVGFAVAHDDDPAARSATDSATDPATDPATDSTTRRAAPGLVRISVRPGEGATAVAANGVTPVGYPATCKGAVAAIASAERVLPVLGAVTGVTEEQWRLTIERIYGQGTPIATFYLGVVRRGATDPAIQRVSPDRINQLDLTTHPEWGGFRVVACEPGRTAIVELLTCYRLVIDRRTTCYAEAREARWADRPGDWVLHEYQAPGDVAPPATRARIDDDADALAGSPPSAGKRAEWLKALGWGWQEFADAPR